MENIGKNSNVLIKIGAAMVKDSYFFSALSSSTFMKQGRNYMGKINLIIMTAFLMLANLITVHADTEIIPFSGYRMGGEFEDINKGAILEIDDEQSYGFLLNIDAGSDSQYEFLYSKQEGQLGEANGVPSDALFDIDIEYFHVGGVNLYELNDKTKSFIGAGLGVSRLTPKVSGYSSETLFSFNISGGIKRQITERLGLRFGLTLLATAVDSQSAIFCNGGCTIRFQGDFFTQYEASVGLIFKF